MISFPDDNAHCHGFACNLRETCLRYVALQQKLKTAETDNPRMLAYFRPDPSICEYYWKID